MKKVKKLGSMVVDRILNRQIKYIDLEKEKEWNVKLDIMISWEEFWNLINFLTSIWPNFSEKSVKICLDLKTPFQLSYNKL